MELSKRGEELHKIYSGLETEIIVGELAVQQTIERESAARQEAITQVLSERLENEQ